LIVIHIHRGIQTRYWTLGLTAALAIDTGTDQATGSYRTHRSHKTASTGSTTGAASDRRYWTSCREQQEILEPTSNSPADTTRVQATGAPGATGATVTGAVPEL